MLLPVEFPVPRCPVSYLGNGLREGGWPSGGSMGLPPGRFPRPLEARTSAPLRLGPEGLGGPTHRRRWLCLSPVDNPLPPVSEKPNAYVTLGTSCQSAIRRPLVRIRPGQVIQVAAEVVGIEGGHYLCGRLDIPLLENGSKGTDLADEDEAWYRVDLLLHGIFTRQGHRAVLRFEAGPPLVLTLTVLIPLTGGEAPEQLEGLLALAFLR